MGTNGQGNVVEVRDSSCGGNVIESWRVVLNQPGESGDRTSETHGPIGALGGELVVSRGRRDVKILSVDAYSVLDILYLYQL